MKAEQEQEPQQPRGAISSVQLTLLIPFPMPWAETWPANMATVANTATIFDMMGIEAGGILLKW